MTTFNKTEVFKRVLVDYFQAGGGRVSWELDPHFMDPGPYIFTLQVSTNHGEPGTWAAVGDPVEDGVYVIDPVQRQYTIRTRVVYRIELTTPSYVYYSPIAQVYGLLTERQWLLARAIVRKLLLQVTRPTLNTLPGKLLKRKLNGTACSCIDEYTGATLNTSHITCYGTGIVGGYWQAVDTNLLDTAIDGSHVKVENNKGTIDEQVLKGKFAGLPMLETRDIWVSDSSDIRYFIHSIKHVSEMNQVPIVTEVELRPIPAGDVIYSFPLT